MKSKIFKGIIVGGLAIALLGGLAWSGMALAKGDTGTSSTEAPSTPTASSTHTSFERPAMGKAHRCPDNQKGDFSNKLNELNLTEEQKTQIQDVLETAREKGQELQDQLREAQQNLMDAIKASPTDNNAIAQAEEKVVEIEKSLLDNRVQTALKLKEILGDKFSDFPFFRGPSEHFQGPPPEPTTTPTPSEEMPVEPPEI